MEFSSIDLPERQTLGCVHDGVVAAQWKPEYQALAFLAKTAGTV